MIPAIVKRGGVIEALGRQYWSPDIQGKEGWEVELHFDQGEETYPSVWTKGRQHRLCTAALVADHGFLDLGGAKDVLRHARAERRKVQEAAETLRIQALVDLIDERIQAHSHPARSSLGSAIAEVAKQIHRAVRTAFGDILGRENVTKHELLHRDDVISELGQIIFGHLSTLQSVEEAKASAARVAAHRLSETRK